MTDTEQRVRERAHQIWEEEGRPHGRHDAHWQLAREQVAGVQALEEMGGPLPEAAEPPARNRVTKARTAKPKTAKPAAATPDAGAAIVPPPARPRRRKTTPER